MVSGVRAVVVIVCLRSLCDCNDPANGPWSHPGKSLVWFPGYGCQPMAPEFRGRSHERQALDKLIEDARAGRSAALVIRGEAGMGKTSLLQYVIGQAAAFRIARLAGMESEMELPF